MKKISKTNVKTFFEILKYLKIYRIHFILSLIFTAISVALTLYVPILIGKAIDLAIGMDNVDIPAITQILLKIGISIIITAVLQWIINALNNSMTYGIVKNIRHEAFDKIQRFPISYIDSNRTGEIVSRVITDVDQFAEGSAALKAEMLDCFKIGIRVKNGYIEFTAFPYKLFGVIIFVHRNHYGNGACGYLCNRVNHASVINIPISCRKNIQAVGNFNHNS